MPFKIYVQVLTDSILILSLSLLNAFSAANYTLLKLSLLLPRP
jgi:hypothetical protein